MNKTPSAEPEVVIVLSDEFASGLRDLAQKHHAWALRTAETEKVAEVVWKEREPADVAPSSSLTLFNGVGEVEADLLSILDTVELHHGLASDQPAVNTLRVLGFEPTDAIRAALSALGFTHIATTGEGFVAEWQRPKNSSERSSVDL